MMCNDTSCSPWDNVSSTFVKVSSWEMFDLNETSAHRQQRLSRLTTGSCSKPEHWITCAQAYLLLADLIWKSLSSQPGKCCCQEKTAVFTWACPAVWGENTSQNNVVKKSRYHRRSLSRLYSLRLVILNPAAAVKAWTLSAVMSAAAFKSF